MADHYVDAGERGVSGNFARRALLFIAILAVALFLWRIADVLLLAFAGVLIAVFLRGLAGYLAERSPLTIKWAFAVVLAVVLLVIGAFAWFSGPRIAEQFGQFTQELPQSVDTLKSRLREYAWGQYIVQYMSASKAKVLPQGLDAISKITGFTSAVLNALTSLFVILFTGIFFGFNPKLYLNGIVALVPKGKSERVREALHTVGASLWKWLLGRFIAMVFVGVATAVGLWALGVPLALLLGLIAGLLDFVAFFGPIVASIPAILIALGKGGYSTALYVALLYFAIQQIEGNLVTPLVQQKMVSIPPAVVVLAVLAFGLLFGLPGFILGVPLALVAMVLIKELYVEDMLGKQVESSS